MQKHVGGGHVPLLWVCYLLEGCTDFASFERLWGSIVANHAARCLSFSSEQQATELSNLKSTQKDMCFILGYTVEFVAGSSAESYYTLYLLYLDSCSFIAHLPESFYSHLHSLTNHGS